MREIEPAAGQLLSIPLIRLLGCSCSYCAYVMSSWRRRLAFTWPEVTSSVGRDEARSVDAVSSSSSSSASSVHIEARSSSTWRSVPCVALCLRAAHYVAFYCDTLVIRFWRMNSLFVQWTITHLSTSFFLFSSDLHCLLFHNIFKQHTRDCIVGYLFSQSIDNTGVITLRRHLCLSQVSKWLFLSGISLSHKHKTHNEE